MVRHSGFFSSLLAVLLAAFSVSMLDRRSAGSHDSRQTHRAALEPSEAEPGRLKRVGLLEDAGIQRAQMSAAPRTLRFQVPRDSFIIVGSLDISGAAHSLKISTHPSEQWTNIAIARNESPTDLQYRLVAGSSQRVKLLQAPNAITATPTLQESDPTVLESASGKHIADTSLRRFLIPHFQREQAIQQPGVASPIAEGSRVKVYVDLSLVDGNSNLPQNHPLRDTAIRACEMIENELLPLIELWIGRITDLDGDHRLSVVLTDLDRENSSNENPVLGCVRRSDFLAHDPNPLAGDIIYLDQHLPQQEQLAALLAHELTHAAVFCFPHEAADDSPMRNHSVPSWLNEAAAHWVERHFCSTPTGYAAREAAFRQNPALCPIILSDDNHDLTSRRTGSRVAGFTFLQQHLSNPAAIRNVLQQSTRFDQSIAATTQASFSELFREWTIRQACETPDAISNLRSRVSCCSLESASQDPVRRKLHGTAFLVVHSEVDQEVHIDAQQNAQLQITVVVHGSDHNSIEHSADLSAFNDPQTAELSIGHAQNIR